MSATPSRSTAASVAVVAVLAAAPRASAAQERSRELTFVPCPSFETTVREHPEFGEGGPIHHADSLDAAPEHLGIPRVPYPSSAQRAGYEATVWIAAVVEEDGATRTAAAVRTTVRGETPLPPPPVLGPKGFEPRELPLTTGQAAPMFARTAVTLAKRSRYRPALKGGVPVRVMVCFSVNFTLERNP